MLFDHLQVAWSLLDPGAERAGEGGHALAHGRDQGFQLGGICARIHASLLRVGYETGVYNQDRSTSRRRFSVSDNSCAHPRSWLCCGCYWAEVMPSSYALYRLLDALLWRYEDRWPRLAKWGYDQLEAWGYPATS